MRTHAAIIVLAVLGACDTSGAIAQDAPVRLLAPSPGVRRSTPATIGYAVERPMKALTIEIVDEYGRVAARFSSVTGDAGALGGEPLPVTPGEHTITWDLRNACGTDFAGLESLADIQDMEPLVVPGTFEVRLATDGGDRLSQPLVVTLDPRMAATQADLEAQLKLAVEMCGRRRTALSAVARMQQAEHSLKGWIASADGGEITRAADRQMLRSLTDLRTAILAPRGAPAAGGKPSWAERLATLQRQVAASDRRPTDAEYAAYRALEAFNDASRRAIVAASPARPLPRDYSGDRCFFTVNFFYNLVPRQ